MKKPLPAFQNDQEAERFVAEANLTEYDLSDIRLIRFQFEPGTEKLLHAKIQAGIEAADRGEFASEEEIGKIVRKYSTDA